MKTWITYLAAAAMGLSATLLFGETVAFQQAMYIISTLLVQFGGLIFIPLVFLASRQDRVARKDGMGGTLVGTTILWSLIPRRSLQPSSRRFQTTAVGVPATSTAGANAP
jgi:predicted lipid-binding transport protein (Tim44 family)